MIISAIDIRPGNVITISGRREIVTKTQRNNNGTITYWSRPINEVGVGIARTAINGHGINVF